MRRRYRIEEVWKPVVNYEGYYEVSNLGRVKSVTRVIWNTRGNGYYQTINSKILNQYQVGAFSDYAIVFLSIAAHRKVHMVHRLVYQSFVGEIPPGMDVDHIDEDSTNNNLDNLN